MIIKTVPVEDINESNRLKKKICKNCKKELKGVFSDDQLKRFEESFYNAFAGVILERRQ